MAVRYLQIAVVLGALAACGEAAFAQTAPPAESLVPETNPAVLAALELPRTEPKHYLSAVLSLVDLHRSDLAAPILQDLAGLQLTDDERAALVQEFGSHRMLQLARTPALAPAGAEFAEACMAAAEKQSQDPRHITALIQQLSSPSPDVRRMALVTLDGAGVQGVAAALEALAVEKDPQRREALVVAIAQMGPEAVGPMLGTLIQQRNQNQFGLDVIRILQAMQVSQAMPLIAAYTGSPDAEHLLRDALERYARGTPAFAPDENNEVALWLWCKGHLQVSSHPAEDAKTLWMARLALALANLRPDITDYHEQALVLAMDAGLWVKPLDGTFGVCDLANIDAQQHVETADSVLLSDVLATAMKQNRVRAAQKAAELLGQRGDVSVLYCCAPQPSPLAGALGFPDRRVRFAALEAIMKLDPQSPFAGDSRVAESLGYFASSANERRAVVAMPIGGQAATIAGRLSAAQIDATPVTRGASAVQNAERTADLEFVLVDVDIDYPGIRDVLYALRTNPATGQIPIGLLATSARLAAAERLADEHWRIVAFPRPQSDAALANLVERLGEISGRDPIGPDERAAMAEKALGWLGNLLARDTTFYDLRQQAPVVEAALYLPNMSDRSIAALALVGTPSSQRALIDFASQRTLPLAARQQAAAAFARSVIANGILLTEEEILGQYARYNASETADPDTQKVLAAILDTFESRRNLQNPPTGFGEGEAPAEPLPPSSDLPAPGSAGASPSRRLLPPPVESSTF